MMKIAGQLIEDFWREVERIMGEMKGRKMKSTRL